MDGTVKIIGIELVHIQTDAVNDTETGTKERRGQAGKANKPLPAALLGSCKYSIQDHRQQDQADPPQASDQQGYHRGEISGSDTLRRGKDADHGHEYTKSVIQKIFQ